MAPLQKLFSVMCICAVTWSPLAIMAKPHSEPVTDPAVPEDSREYKAVPVALKLIGSVVGSAVLEALVEEGIEVITDAVKLWFVDDPEEPPCTPDNSICDYPEKKIVNARCKVVVRDVGGYLNVRDSPCGNIVGTLRPGAQVSLPMEFSTFDQVARISDKVCPPSCNDYNGCWVKLDSGAWLAQDFLRC